MENVIIDFSVEPAKAKCSKCGKVEEIAPQKKLTDTIKLAEEIKAKHKTCK